MKNFSSISFICGYFLGVIILIFCISDLKNNYEVKINRYKKEIIEKDDIIEAQAKTIVNGIYDNCSCGWYEDFYYEHASEVGANE